LTTVILRPNESQDMLLKRFRKKVAKSGILSTVRRKRCSSQERVEADSEEEAIRRLKRGNERWRQRGRQPASPPEGLDDEDRGR
jgi:small subunit ribosomal protein S21